MRQQSQRTILRNLKSERDHAVTCAVLNAETIRVQRREFQATIADLQRQLGTAKRDLRLLLNAEVATIVALPNEKYASVEMILAFPDEFEAHQRCATCDNIEPHSHGAQS